MAFSRIQTISNNMDENNIHMLMDLLRFIIGGDYSDEARRHAKGLLLALLRR